MKAHFEAFQLQIDAMPSASQRLCLHHAPGDVAPIGLVIHVHALADEMNKSRRMAALQARDLARAGFAVLQIDLFGCGDSDGDFGDATWARWRDDLAAARAWLAKRHGENLPVWLWGHRVGALLAVDAATRWPQACHFLFWQPVAAGNSALQQFLRLRSMGDLSGRAPAVTTEQLRGQLRDGRPIDIAGYSLSPGLAQGLEQARLVSPGGPMRQVIWLDLSTRDELELLPAAAQTVSAWQAGGHAVHAEVLRGPAFWQTTEIEEVPELVAATTRACLQATAALHQARQAA